MSKTTHEKARERAHGIFNHYPLKHEFFMEYIDKQEKQEKLLELYREYFKLNCVEVLSGAHVYGNDKNTQASINVILKIKELENE